ncbi:MAG: sigma-70 family RNA polymerase sigma factor [Deltaproteobacteria bacterium]|nr:sigma-70 family RNA polymerase sigma factor [Deltaproteobacteria bacterium]
MKLSYEVDADWNRWCRGDAAAGARAFAQLRPALLRFFTRRRPEAAEDLTQETLAACVRARGGFRGESRLSTYVFTIAQRQLSGSRQRRRVETSMHRVAVDPDQCAATSRLDEVSDRRAVRAAVSALPEHFRGVVEHYYWAEERGPGIAQRLSIPESTVRSRLRRGLALLRRDLQRDRLDAVCR